MVSILNRRRSEPVTAFRELRENNIVLVLEDVRSGRKRKAFGRNLVTNDGDQFYAEAIVASGSVLLVAGMNLGSSAVAPTKTDTNVGSIVANGSAATDSGYPRTADNDADNTGAAADSVTWRSTFGTAAGNANGIQEIAVANVLGTAGTAKCVSRGTLASFNKTSSDTLKVFVNHNILGV